MNLSPDLSGSGENRITGYGADYVLVKQQRFEKSVVVLADRIETWDVASFEDFRLEHFRFIESLKPEIVLLGTGNRLRFPPAHLAQPLMEARIGMEVMDTRAACRTYNILSGEGRRVAAALVIERNPDAASGQ